MVKRIEEKQLILPALRIIEEHPNITTSKLINELETVFKPTGEDAELLAGRKDTKFSQKVRNLKSHRENNGMQEWTNYNKGKYSITEEGRQFLAKNSNAVDYLFDNSFEYDDVQDLLDKTINRPPRKKVLVYSEDEMITEGKKTRKKTTIRQRSTKLRDAAIEHYTNENGRITCAVCEFDFEETYGQIGAGYIQMHHEKPIFQLSDEGFEEYVSEAINRMKPVCSNCHSMIHRNIKNTLSIAELKERLNAKN